MPIVVRDVTVSRIEDVTPCTRRLTLTGPDLAGGERDGFSFGPFRSEGFDDHVKLVIPDADGTAPFAGRQNGDRFDWEPGVLPLTRDYTVRRVAPDGSSFDIDVVRHDSGRASDWAFGCSIGDPISFAGPKCSSDVVSADWHLLMGDETALPAIGRWLEEAPAGTRAQVVVEVPSSADRQQIQTRADAQITWLVRPDGTAPGHSTQLFDTLRGLQLPEGRGYVWCAGETLTMAPIRRYLRGDLALPKQDVEVVGYWRRTSEVAPVEEAEAPASASPMQLMHQVHEMTELLAPLAIRAAVTLGLPERLADGSASISELGTHCQVPPTRLAPLLDALVALELFIGDPDGYQLTALGEVLLEEHVLDSVNLDDPIGASELALVHLVEVLRSGRPHQPDGRAETLARRRVRDQDADIAFEARAEDGLQWCLQPLVELDPVQGAETLTVLGDGALPLALMLAGARPSRKVQLLVRPHALDRTLARLSDSAPASVLDRVDVRALPTDLASAEVPACDTAIVIGALDELDDQAYQQLAAHLVQAASSIVVITELADEATTDDHIAADSLLALCLHGTPLRTAAAHEQLLTTAGANDVQAAPLGWGFGPSVITARTPRP